MRSTEKRVTLKDVATHCGVSTMTVSWALRGDSTHVSEETRDRVRQAAEELGYSAARTHAARRLRYSSGGASEQPINHLVALTFSWGHIDSPYFIRLLKGMGEVLHAKGYSLLTDWTITRETNTLPPVFSRGEVDGVVGIEGTAGEDMINVLRGDPGFGDRPIVSLFAPFEGCSSVISDDCRGGYLLAEHLLNCGHRYLAHTAVIGHAHESRHQGYRDALSAAGLDPSIHLRPLNFNHEKPSSIDRALGAHMQLEPRTTALLAGNDYLAVKLASSCDRLGLRIPDDLAVVGFDDTHELPDERGVNLLTTVRYSQTEAGRRAAQVLVEAIENRQLEPRVETLPVQLIVRGSCGAPQTTSTPKGAE